MRFGGSVRGQGSGFSPAVFRASTDVPIRGIFLQLMRHGRGHALARTLLADTVVALSGEAAAITLVTTTCFPRLRPLNFVIRSADKAAQTHYG